eukprot:CAMPEP_0175962180 /NCGR_PEP_ID=MMETSP0108-20121206/36340_1 /TAXON_ID=195067 ORGANISM="Goniomonas pacifica, Strain CCMP1869" /NCGR_SAMPLE_ID=MMETSP0108 /ASSEMBLY_ACC=CAM_ASM_000204 /LENGTH=116 /DNA_ID=CAMNT_0017289977 /DNA_START=387 /DNA_END=737 /DNA_ORIENTATION=-
MKPRARKTTLRQRPARLSQRSQADGQIKTGGLRNLPDLFVGLHHALDATSRELRRPVSDGCRLTFQWLMRMGNGKPCQEGARPFSRAVTGDVFVEELVCTEEVQTLEWGKVWCRTQ